MTSTLSEPSSTERVLEIQVERERLDAIFEDKLKKYSREVRLNGFRPGKVPKEVVAARFREPISAEALESLVDEALKEACKTHNLEPIAPGHIDKLDNEPGKPIAFKALLEVDPPLELKEYRLEIPLRLAEIADADVQGQLDAMRKRRGDETVVDRPAAAGDVVVGEYLAIAVEGEDKPLPQQREFRLELGSSSIPELDKALAGCVAGEERTATFTFPAQGVQAELAGRGCVYRLRIVAVNEVKYPDLDDAFANGYGFDSLEAFRARIRDDLNAQALRQAKEAAYEEAMRRLLEANPFDVPKARIHNYVKYKLEEAQHKHDGDCDHSDLEREAVFNIKRYRLLDEISKREKIKAAAEEVDERVRSLARQYGMDFETLKASLRKNGKIIDIREEIKSEKTLDFVIGLKRDG